MLQLVSPRALALLPVAVALIWWAFRGSFANLSAGRRRLSLAVRLTLIATLTLTLTTPMLRAPARRPPVVILVDVSNSISDAQLERARGFVDEAWAARGETTLEVATFAGHARRAELSGGKPAVTRHDADGSDLAEAITFARSLVPDGAPRIVLITDGFVTSGDALATARQAVAHGATLEIANLGGPDVVDARVTALRLPDTLRRHEPARLGAIVESSRAGNAIVRLEENSLLIQERPAALLPGVQTVDFDLDPTLSGLVRYAVEIQLSGDRIAGNNRFTQLVQISGPPRVLLAAASPEEGRHLEEALTAQEFSVETSTPAALPSSVDALLGYDEVILAGISPHELNPLRQNALATYVRDTGGGLLFVSGARGLRRDSEGRDNLLEHLLPVELAAPSERQEPPVALALLIDQSGSMVGEKLNYAKQAAMAVVDRLSARDQLGVIAFDANFQWLVPLGPLDDKQRIKTSIGGLGAGGGTRFLPALEEAYFTLGSTEAAVRHVILLTDGVSTDPDVFPELLAKAHKSGVTVSTVAIGHEADVKLLEQIAKLGGGRFTLATSAGEVPNIFVKETQTIQRDAAQRTDTKVRVAAPARELAGIDFDTAPPLRGYLRTKSKATAEVLLETPERHPLLVRWRYGLGAVAAFTSDATASWAELWLTQRWEGFGKLWSQLARGLQRPRVRHDLTLSLTPREHRLDFDVDAIGHDGHYLNELDVRVRIIRGDEPAEEVKLAQVGPGHYAAGADDTGGSLLALPLGSRAGRRLEGDWVVLARPYPMELAAIGRNQTLLGELERLGRRVQRAAELNTPAEHMVPHFITLTLPLSLLAVALFLLDLILKRARWDVRR